MSSLQISNVNFGDLTHLLSIYNGGAIHPPRDDPFISACETNFMTTLLTDYFSLWKGKSFSPALYSYSLSIGNSRHEFDRS